MTTPLNADFDVPGMMDYIKERFQNLADQFSAALLANYWRGQEFENPDLHISHSISEICLVCTEFENAWGRLHTVLYELDGFSLMLDCISGTDQDCCELLCKDGTVCDRSVPIPAGMEFHGGIDWDEFERRLPDGIYERLISGIRFSDMDFSNPPGHVHVFSAFLRESHYIATRFGCDGGNEC